MTPIDPYHPDYFTEAKQPASAGCAEMPCSEFRVTLRGKNAWDIYVGSGRVFCIRQEAAGVTIYNEHNNDKDVRGLPNVAAAMACITSWLMDTQNSVIHPT